ncbi:unnamed protein product [Paramecium sonneborni]|uniref:Uncharacterized protein n=1 Tax=Paramecium sonneborni TaxID=65129 RepID=A0A8S1Q3W7_9CILI|nr:unnamed protein product [Paramecium sonneborni]
MNNSNKNFKKDFNIVQNMKKYFQNNIGQIKQHFEEEAHLDISSNSEYILLPDLKSMVFNIVDLERNDFDQLSINQSMFVVSSTEASSIKISVNSQSLTNNSFSSNSALEDF